jgi:hypothetical protein
MAIESALFGIVYRYAIREDPNPQLKDGTCGQVEGDGGSRFPDATLLAAGPVHALVVS